MANGNRPNIVYILADDMGYGDISYLNEASKINTIHLDRMAREGMAFTDAHSSSAVCTPSRYSILTGRYNWRSALKQFVLFGYDAPLIEKERMTVASMLKEAGYRTACIGKWHLGLDWSRSGDNKEDVDFTRPVSGGPVEHGFDYFFGISASLDMAPYVYIENDRVTAVPDSFSQNPDPMQMWRHGPVAPDFKHEEVLQVLTQKVLDTLETNRDEPFFIYFPLTAPHTPILPSEPFQGKSGTNSYGDFVLMCDDVVGQINAKLEELGLSDNTIVIYTSDNGCSPRANYSELLQVGHNPSYIFRGTKADIYEGGHRIPLIIKWPAGIQAGSICGETVCLVDLMRTAAELIGYQLPDNTGEDSVSNLPLWRGEPLAAPLREAVVHHSIDGSFSIRQGRWKLELCPGSGGWSDPVPGQEPADSPPIQLYDLTQDIGERRNMWDQQPEVVERLRTLLISYIEDGRSTPGARQQNTGVDDWPQLARVRR
ncbi:sulfatase family protein [Paenibacillus thalictri]|uniref:Arylsulfatase n=1 Tax=Paenibacillus thalictri TaxID=2527873 RepID=A0A4V2J3F4_9BACL|nr:arylsulfatase [Paenibacillus thalictri]TBL71582.1 arylsulfatase [Paenibacillus thalictri]